MKKILLILAVVFSAASANAQFADSGFKTIAELGLNIGWNKVSNSGQSLSVFGMVTPSLQSSFGGMICRQVYVGAGLGYSAYIPVSDLNALEGGKASTVSAVKLYGHARFYTSPAGNGVIIDTTLGYQRAFGNVKANMFDFFVGPGYLFSDRYAVAVGYTGAISGKDSYGNTIFWHGPAVKFSVEF